MAYFTTLPVPKKGAKLTALHLAQLGVDLAAVTPTSLSAMPGSRDTAVVKLKVCYILLYMDSWSFKSAMFGVQTTHSMLFYLCRLRARDRSSSWC